MGGELGHFTALLSDRPFVYPISTHSFVFGIPFCFTFYLSSHPYCLDSFRRWYIAREYHGLPWGIPGQPVPIPLNPYPSILWVGVWPVQVWGLTVCDIHVTYRHVMLQFCNIHVDSGSTTPTLCWQFHNDNSLDEQSLIVCFFSFFLLFFTTKYHLHWQLDNRNLDNDKQPPMPSCEHHTTKVRDTGKRAVDDRSMGRERMKTRLKTQTHLEPLVCFQFCFHSLIMNHWHYTNTYLHIDSLCV